MMRLMKTRFQVQALCKFLRILPALLMMHLLWFTRFVALSALMGKKVSLEKVIKLFDELVATVHTVQQDDVDKKEYCEAALIAKHWVIKHLFVP